MSSVKQDTIAIVNELIPHVCPEEQELFDIFSDSLFERTVNTEGKQRLGDESYFGESADLISQFMISVFVTLVAEQSMRKTGSYSWKKLIDAYRDYRGQKIKVPEDLDKALEKALEEKAKAESKIAELNAAINQEKHDNIRDQS